MRIYERPHAAHSIVVESEESFLYWLPLPRPAAAPAHSNTVRVGPRLASPIAAARAAAKLSFSWGGRKLAIGSLRPRDTRYRRCSPNSSSVSYSSRAHNGLSAHSDTWPRWLTLRTRSSDGITTTSS